MFSPVRVCCHPKVCSGLCFEVTISRVAPKRLGEDGFSWDVAWVEAGVPGSVMRTELVTGPWRRMDGLGGLGHL